MGFRALRLVSKSGAYCCDCQSNGDCNAAELYIHLEGPPLDFASSHICVGFLAPRGMHFYHTLNLKATIHPRTVQHFHTKAEPKLYIHIMGGSDYKAPPPKQVRIRINGGPLIKFGKSCLGGAGPIPILRAINNPKRCPLSQELREIN